MSGFNLQRRPAVRSLGLLAAGILLGSIVPFRSSCILLLLIVLFLLFGLFLLLKKRLVGDGLLILLVLAAGLYLQLHQREVSAGKKLDPIREEPIWIAGRVESEPVRKEKKISFVLNTEILKWAGHEDRTGRRILITLRGLAGRSNPLKIQCGSGIVGRATIQPFPIQRNAGEFDYGRYLTLNDIQGIATIAAPEDFVVKNVSPYSSFGAFVGLLQRSLYGIIDHFHTPEQASFLKGVILGYRADLSNEIKQSFMNTGTIHILAVSGSNVAVIVLIIYSVFGFLRLPRRLSGAATILGIVLFTFITGASPSVVRAAIMATVILLGTTFERKADVYNSLSVAAIIILVMDSNALFDVGFQLSFAAVLSIVSIYPVLAKLIARIPERFEEIKGIDYVLKLFAVSLAAQIGTLPFTAYYFGRVSLISLLANLIVVPLSGLNVLLGVATVAVSLVSPFLASCYASLNKIAVDFLLGFVKVAGNVPYAYAETLQFGLFGAVFYYGIVVVLLHGTNPKVVKWGLVTSLAFLTVYFGKQIVDHRNGVLRVTILDVGQGDAILIEPPNHRNILVDAGPRQYKYDAGERVIVPFLHRLGIKELDAVVVTHSHSDHIGGIVSVFRNVAVRDLLEADVGASSAMYRNTKEAVRLAGGVIKQTRQGECVDVDPAVRLYVLHPTLPRDLHKSLNNTSIVLKLKYGATSAMLSGDAETDAEVCMRDRYGTFLASDILKVGHHGSSTSSSAGFLRFVRPAAAIISVGTRNRFGHPSQGTIGRLTKLGSQVFRTDREGALVFESDGYSWWQYDWREHSRLKFPDRAEG